MVGGVSSATSAADQFTYALIDIWTGASGIDNNWNTPANWNTGIVPTAAYSVIIDTTGTVNLTGPAYAASLTFSAGTITGSGALSVVGPLTWTGGSMSGCGQHHRRQSGAGFLGEHESQSAGP